MQNPAVLQQRVEQALAEVDWIGNPSELYDPIAYIMGLGGKRIRPLLLLMAADMFGGSEQDALPLAIGVEVFHNFTLLHDDIMDKAPLRRGKPTVHEHWNSNIAILSGDTMFVRACQFMMRTKPQYMEEVLNLFYKTAIEVCEGQQLDMNFENRNDVSIAEYERMIELKTAVLLATALRIGAITAGASAIDAGNLYEFGRCLGLAFQLQDDILDVYGQADKFGKQVGGDILSDKKTYLLLKALEAQSSVSEVEELKQIIEGQAGLAGAQKVERVTAIYDRLNIKEMAWKEMQGWFERAMESLNAVNVADERKQSLRVLAEQLLMREA